MPFSSFFSSSKPQWIYDVFLNFRGEDTRNTIVGHLNAALTSAGINTFIDNRLEKGTELAPELMRAIEGSQIAVVVFSKGYTQSSWCLMELVKIMECRETYGQVILPIFYNIDPVVVRKQLKGGGFGEALEALAKRNYSDEQEQIKVLSRWRSVLQEASNLSGWHTTPAWNEAVLVNHVVNQVLTRVGNTFLSITEFPVGLDSRVQQVIRFLGNHSSQVCLIGIGGRGGSGKTTVAKAVYNQIHREFVDRSFIENIREVCEKDSSRGPIVLQEQLLFNVLKEKVEVHSIAMGKSIIDERLLGKKVLIVLDDVTEFEQLKALCGNRKWIGQGSVIIITTRDVRLLTLFQVDYVYKMEEMNTNESLELFSWHAFKERIPSQNFAELSRNVAAYCGGLPLALEVLGSYLYQRTKEEWRSVLSKLQRIPDDQVQEKLRISFDGLKNDMEKDIFLDICCFFIGKARAYVTDILNGCGLCADIGITVLIERSLIKVGKNNKLAVHDLLRDMGREIIRETSKKEPEKRSRLWSNEDALPVLTKNTGTEAIEGFALNLDSTSRDCFNANAFKEMRRLRLLQLNHVQLTGDYGYLSKELRWVYWKGFPLRYVPNNFYLGNVVAIDLKYSNLKLWKHPQYLEWLKILNLSHSKYLTTTPDFSRIKNLEKLILKDCPSLLKVHESIGDLHNLVLINLKDCTSLSNLPSETYKLKSVKTFIISGCSKIDKLDEDIVQMESLTILIADNTAIKQVPFSIVRSKSIGYISLCGYEGLSRNVFPSIVLSWMSPTTKPLSYIHPFQGLSLSSVSTDMQNTNMSDLMPMVSSLSKLRSVLLRFDTTIQLKKFLHDIYGVNYTGSEIPPHTSQISKHSLRYDLIRIGSYHKVFNTLCTSISKGFTNNDSCDVLLPGDNVPYWLTHASEGHSVFFVVPQDCLHMKGMALCVVYSSSPENAAAECVLIVNYTKCTIQIYKRDTVISSNDEDWQGLLSSLGPGDQVEIFVTYGQGMAVEKTAVFLIYNEPNNVEMTPSSDVLITGHHNGSSQPSPIFTNTEITPAFDVLVKGHHEGSSQPSRVFTNTEMAASVEPKENAFIRLIKKVALCKCTKSFPSF